MPGTGAGVPQTSRIRRLVRAYRVRRPPPIANEPMLRLAQHNKARRFTALVVATALAAAPTLAAAQENRGPPILRDTEAEQLLRDYTRPILRAAGLEKQNIQMVIINEGSFNAFV